MLEINKKIHSMMGLCWHVVGFSKCVKCGKNSAIGDYWDDAPKNYSTHIGAAFRVVAFFTKRPDENMLPDYYVSINFSGALDSWTVKIGHYRTHKEAIATDETLPMAICLAALKMKEIV